MSLEEVALEPDKQVVRAFMFRAVSQHIDTPVENAFDDEWPVYLSDMEAEEVLEALKKTRVRRFVPYSKERKELAIKEVQESRMKAQSEEKEAKVNE